MKRFTLFLLVIGLSGLGLSGLGLSGLGETAARAQVGYVTYYQPVPVYQPAYPTTAYPTNGVFYSSYYAPAPIPVPVYRPVTRVRTRYRPILGGTVTRVRRGYAPAYYNPAPLIYAY